jgi:hypothetical protein
MTTKKERPVEAPGKEGPVSDQKGEASASGGAKQQAGTESTQDEAVLPAIHNAQARNIGRPRVRFEALKTVPTRCPAQIYTYLKGIAPFLYASLTEMFEDMMTRFVNERPWEHGLHWRKPKTATTFAGGEQGRTGWEQVNMQLPPKLADLLTKTSTECGVSNAAFCYTAIFWWVQYIYPPEKMMPKK